MYCVEIVEKMGYHRLSVENEYVFFLSFDARSLGSDNNVELYAVHQTLYSSSNASLSGSWSWWSNVYNKNLDLNFNFIASYFCFFFFHSVKITGTNCVVDG